MIIQEINATVNGNSLSGEVIVPSPVLTASKQAEDGNLTKSPNFKLKLTGATPEMNIIDTVQVEFTNGDFNYTANMTVINTQQNGTVTLQYVDGLTVEEVVHTLEFSPVGPFYTYYDKYTDTITQSESTYLLYDGNKVENPMIYLDNQMGLGGSYTMGIPSLNSIYWIPNSASKNNEVGEYSDRFTATYKGMTATVNVTLTITQEEPDEPTIGDFSFSIDSTNYDQGGSSFTDNGDNTWTVDLLRTYPHGDYDLPFFNAEGNVIFDAAYMYNNNQGDPIFDIIIDDPNEYNASATFRTAPSYGADDQMLGSMTAAIGKYKLTGKIRTNVTEATVYLTDDEYNAITNADKYYTYDGSQYDNEYDGEIYKRYTLDLTPWQNAEGNALITLEVFDPNSLGT